MTLSTSEGYGVDVEFYKEYIAGNRGLLHPKDDQIVSRIFQICIGCSQCLTEGKQIHMSKGWFALVVIFAMSVGLIIFGIVSSGPELVISGVGLGVFLYFVRNFLT